jgi:septum formation protein
MTNIDVPVKPQITLASASPRRRELLDQIQVSYNILPVNIDESHNGNESAEQFVQRLALEKARAGYALAPALPALGSDTIVVYAEQILGKPENREHGTGMLRMLAGKSHRVITAVAICYGEIEHCELSTSEVEFTCMDEQQIEAYWETGEPVDKAGGYAIQGIAAQFIKNIKGSYSGVMGLPLYETAQLLELIGIKTFR